MYAIKPFKINVPQEVLDDLSLRLEHTRWTDEPENAGWNYGTNPRYLRDLAAYWQKDYDWRRHETEINRHPQFKVEIDGVTIHYVHVKGKGKDKSPLLLCHGWPDSFYRFLKVLPLITDPAKSAHSFDVVIPSIPGFGFSQQIAMNTDKTAKLFHKLMVEVLGYSNYFAAGGDMGSEITKSLAVQFTQNIPAIHLTDVGYPNGSEDWGTMSPAEQEFGQVIQRWFFADGAFNMIQSTKPQTLGYALNDSPVGLASWMIEKFYAWSDHEGDLESCLTKDDLITQIMIYWVGQSINSSIRTYAENARAQYSGGLKSSQKVETPTGISLFPKEAQFPMEWAERKVRVANFSVMKKGGHFAAMEVPEVFANELLGFFGARRL